MGGIGGYWAVLGGIGGGVNRGAVVGGIGRYWAVLGGIGRYWEGRLCSDNRLPALIIACFVGNLTILF